MRYLCLGYYDEDAFDRLSPGELEKLVGECGVHDAALRASGHLVSVASLAHRSARSLRPDGGATSVTDGPFAETKEIVGSFFVIEAADLDDAVRIASLHPAAQLGERLGWGVEVRPIDSFEAM
jgi:hypothetical protein